MAYLYSSGNDHQPLTPLGVIFSQPDLYQTINCAVTVAGPIDVHALKVDLENSAFTSLPRFTSLLVHNPKTGCEHWCKTTTLVIDNHVKVINDEMCQVNDYLADLAVSCPLPTDKPLWEVHILHVQNCVIFRVHHALGDGVSFMSLLQSLFNPGKSQLTGTILKKPIMTNGRNSIWDLLKIPWFMLIFSFEFILRCLWVKDEKTPISGGDGVQFWPRKLATASFMLEDIIVVKKSILPNATINDVIMGVLSSGISDYINLQPSNGVKESKRITCMVLVNLRNTKGIPEISDLMKADSGSGWGNKIGFILHPIYTNIPNAESDPLHQLKVAKINMDKRKLSKVARLSHITTRLAVSIFGPKFANWMVYKLTVNTTLLMSNIVGPSQEATLAGKLVKSIKISISSLPQAITIHMVSYAGKVEMQIMVAKDIIQDPKVLAKCFEDALQRMKKAVISIK